MTPTNTTFFWGTHSSSDRCLGDLEWNELEAQECSLSFQLGGSASAGLLLVFRRDGLVIRLLGAEQAINEAARLSAAAVMALGDPNQT
jgi:hypothetical protein